MPVVGRLFGTTQGAMKADGVSGRLCLQSLTPLALLLALVGLAVRRRVAGPPAGYEEVLPNSALAHGLQASAARHSGSV